MQLREFWRIALGEPAPEESRIATSPGHLGKLRNTTDSDHPHPLHHPLNAAHPTAIMPQDMPPTGGYEPVQYKRNLPARGFRPSVYLAGVVALMTYGFYKVGKGIREQK